MRTLVPWLALLLCVVGCDDPGLRIELVAEGFDPEVELDALEISLAAAQSGPDDDGVFRDSAACEPTYFLANEQTVGDLLPLTVVVRPGEAGWRCVALSIDGIQGRRVRLIQEEVLCVDLDEGVVERQVVIDGRCLGTGNNCDLGEVCAPERPADERCVPSTTSTLFEGAAVSGPCNSEL